MRRVDSGTEMITIIYQKDKMLLQRTWTVRAETPIRGLSTDTHRKNCLKKANFDGIRNDLEYAELRGTFEHVLAPTVSTRQRKTRQQYYNKI